MILYFDVYIRKDSLNFVSLRSDFYAALHMSSLGYFYRLCIDYFDFSLILKGFNRKCAKLASRDKMGGVGGRGGSTFFPQTKVR